MGQRWVKRGEEALDKLQKIYDVEGKDRLELVKSIKYSLALLNRSIKGWGVWVSNPATMANFSKEELEEMEDKLIDFAKTFIEYDINATQLGLEKGLNQKRGESKKIRFIV